MIVVVPKPARFAASVAINMCSGLFSLTKDAPLAGEFQARRGVAQSTVLKRFVPQALGAQPERSVGGTSLGDIRGHVRMPRVTPAVSVASPAESAHASRKSFAV